MSSLFRLLRRGADKSLARKRRKQATATKLGIYSTYSSWSSIHFLARCSNFCKSLKKKIRMLSNQPGLHGSNDLRVGRKMATLQLFFQSREHMVLRRVNRVGDQETVSSGLQVPGETRHCRARTRPPWWPSRGVFPSKCPSIAPAEMGNAPRW